MQHLANLTKEIADSARNHQNSKSVNDAVGGSRRSLSAGYRVLACPAPMPRPAKGFGSRRHLS